MQVDPDALRAWAKWLDGLSGDIAELGDGFNSAAAGDPFPGTDLSGSIYAARDQVKSSLESFSSRPAEMAEIAKGVGDKFEVTPGAGHAYVGALDSATDAASKAEAAQLLKADSRSLGGLPLGAAVNAYVNWDDWKHHQKPGDEAIANAAGGTAGGWAGAAAGASLGALACSPFPVVGQAFCAGVGAGMLGMGVGAGGAWAAEQPFK